MELLLLERELLVPIFFFLSSQLPNNTMTEGDEREARDYYRVFQSVTQKFSVRYFIFHWYSQIGFDTAWYKSVRLIL